MDNRKEEKSRVIDRVWGTGFGVERSDRITRHVHNRVYNMNKTTRVFGCLLLLFTTQVLSSSSSNNLQKLIQFSDHEWHLFQSSLENHATTTSQTPPTNRPRCTTPTSCGREAFARLHVAFHRMGIAPTGLHQWARAAGHPRESWPPATFSKHATPSWLSQSDADPLASERIQLAFFLTQIVRPYLFKKGHAHASNRLVCLDWDGQSQTALDTVFQDMCVQKNLFEYEPDPTNHRVIDREPANLGTIIYSDLLNQHSMSDLSNAFGLVICEQVLEHLPDPVKSMQALYNLTAPGGFVVFGVPSVAMVHMMPYDYWRFTLPGAIELARAQGFKVLKAYAPSHVGVITGSMQGINPDYFTLAEILDVPAAVPWEQQGDIGFTHKRKSLWENEENEDECICNGLKLEENCGDRMLMKEMTAWSLQVHLLLQK